MKGQQKHNLELYLVESRTLATLGLNDKDKIDRYLKEIIEDVVELKTNASGSGAPESTIV
ncbi:hypothetical protein L484_018947 [Morus notabilis]|uniref:Uncharacterized protein n=1 Tax=Morus notabilis TaxID=981085 RepID=W9S8R2_9ROSA|nr:hypothetical protein L484_018947 [Morus notabilis]